MRAHKLDPTLEGVLLGFLSFALFSFSDASVKLIEGRLPPYESAFFGAVFALLVLPFLLKPGERLRDVFATRQRGLWLLRFAAYPLGVMGSVFAFTHLSMAEAFVLIFLQPAIVTAMSVLFLKEQVGVRRWSAVAIGLLGVVIVLRPGFRELTAGHLGALIAGLSGAISVIAFRAADPRETRISLFGAGVLGGVIGCFFVMLPQFRLPSGEEWALLAAYGLLAALANLVLMQATMLAPAGWISPTQYSQMLWALLLGHLLFGDGVDLPMVLGIALIVGSGLLTLVRERVRGTALPPPVSAGVGHAAASMVPDTPSSPRS